MIAMKKGKLLSLKQRRSFFFIPHDGSYILRNTKIRKLQR